MKSSLGRTAGAFLLTASVICCFVVSRPSAAQDATPQAPTPAPDDG